MDSQRISKVDIVACTDKWFVMPTGVMMYSICVNNPDTDIVFHIIIDDSVTVDDRYDLEETIAPFVGKTVFFYSSNIIDSRWFPQVKSITFLSKSTYYRLFIAEILPQTIDKVLYLDGDIIVRHSLLPLWNVDLGNYPIGAIPEQCEGDIEFYNRLQIPPQLGYFNAGVLLINMKYWRDHCVVNLFREYMSEHSSDIKYHDQDILNVIFCRTKIWLPIKYNFQQGFLYKKPQYDYWRYEKEVLEARKDPVILHFMGFKPWHVYSRWPIHPFANTFFKYQNQTKWKGMMIDQRPFKVRVLNFVGDMLRKYGLKSPIIAPFQYIDISPID